jgi:recombination protein RecT
MANLAVAENREAVKMQLMDAKEMIQPVLPGHVDFDRCVAQLYKFLYQDPKLAECTPASLFWAFVEAAEVGLNVGTFFGEGFIIPYGSSRDPNAPKRAKFIPGYKGLIKLAYQSPLVNRVDGYVIYEKDHFNADLGQNYVEYVPYIGGDRPGAVTAGYVQIELVSGSVKHTVMPLYALEHVRLGAPGGNNRNHPWCTNRPEMYRKTALRYALKDAPKSSETDKALERAIQMDEQSDNEDAYEDVKQLPGLSEEQAKPTRTEATRTRVAARTTTRRTDEAKPETKAQPKAEPKAKPEPKKAQQPRQPPKPAISTEPKEEAKAEAPKGPAKRQAPVQAKPQPKPEPKAAEPAAPAAKVIDTTGETVKAPAPPSELDAQRSQGPAEDPGDEDIFD